MQTYEGQCHCGAVRFEVDTDLQTEKIIECNCTHCDAKGLILTFVPATQFRLLSGEENLETYHFNKGRIDHLTCKKCGVQPFGRGKKQDGTPTVAVNIRCLKGVDRSTLTITPVDGKSY
jgi:hypothetical protein